MIYSCENALRELVQAFAVTYTTVIWCASYHQGWRFWLKLFSAHIFTAKESFDCLLCVNVCSTSPSFLCVCVSALFFFLPVFLCCSLVWTCSVSFCVSGSGWRLPCLWLLFAKTPRFTHCSKFVVHLPTALKLASPFPLNASAPPFYTYPTSFLSASYLSYSPWLTHAATGLNQFLFTVKMKVNKA